MSIMKDFRQFIAEDVCKKNNLEDLNEGFKAADKLWEDATVGKSKTAQKEIGVYAKKYRGE